MYQGLGLEGGGLRNSCQIKKHDKQVFRKKKQVSNSITRTGKRDVKKTKIGDRSRKRKGPKREGTVKDGVRNERNCLGEKNREASDTLRKGGKSKWS